MTKRVGNVVFLGVENKQQCDFCGKIDELRPYGPKGECICFDCGMKNRATTEAAFARLISDEAPK